MPKPNVVYIWNGTQWVAPGRDPLPANGYQPPPPPDLPGFGLGPFGTGNFGR